jgi:hypothetical protein
MRADICEPTEEKKVERFRCVLRELGAIEERQTWAIGVDLWTVRVRGMELRIFQDEWSLDIEGPYELVAHIRQRMLQPEEPIQPPETTRGM